MIVELTIIRVSQTLLTAQPFVVVSNIGLFGITSLLGEENSLEVFDASPFPVGFVTSLTIDDSTIFIQLQDEEPVEGTEDVAALNREGMRWRKTGGY